MAFRKTFLLWNTLMLAAPAAGPALAQPANAEASEIEELRREVRQLRAQLQALRSALSEAAEFDRLRSTALSRALKGAPGEAPAAPREDVAEPAAPRPAAPKLGAAPAAPPPREAPRARPAPVAEAPGGVVRGKLDVPPGEPVAYVYVENVRGPAARGERVKIDQVRKQFVPPWAVVQRGTTVEFPNMDNIYHNVFSLSSGNQFDLGLYNSSGEAKAHTFNEPGSVDVYCNIHPQMAASVLVVPNRHFAKVKSDGTFEIPGVPSGKRKIVAWAPGSRLASTWVDVDAGGAAEVALKLERKTAGHKNKQGRSYGSYE